MYVELLGWPAQLRPGALDFLHFRPSLECDFLQGTTHPKLVELITIK